MEPPPAAWAQRRRTGLPFPPGRDGDEFEIYLDAGGAPGRWTVFQVNLRSLEVFTPAGGSWTAPAWHELPRRLRERLRKSSAAPPP
jgi:hypothetical protein